MESERLTTSDRTLVPNRFVVHLNPADLAEFGDMTGSLASELADGALSFARAHRYTVVDRPRVDLLADPTVERTDIRVDARFAEAVAGRSGHGAGRPNRRTRARRRRRRPDADAGLHHPSPEDAARGPARDRPGRQDARGRRRGRDLTIGRATDNDLVARDGRVSRHHGRIAGRRGTLVYADLGSTNGSRVNGVPVTEVVLGVGDRLEVGDTMIVVEVAGGASD